MKLHCNVEVYDKKLFSKRKSQRAILAFYKKSVRYDDIYLYLQTRQNIQGTMYPIIDNVDNVFKRFISDGKATISLKQPSHDLIIQGSTIQLKSFLHILERITNGHYEHVDKYILTTITSFNAKEFSSIQKRKVVVKKKSEYPILQGFPKITEELFLSGLDRVSFDRQILTLQSLKTLDLSKNKISFFPKELGKLPCLQNLYVSGNHLGTSTQSKWAWLDQTAIQNNLLLLDISDNRLHELPLQVGKLNHLITLKVCQNLLEELPQNIGRLQCLKYLDVAKNYLTCLPGTVTHLKLQYLDISSNNNFKFTCCSKASLIQTRERVSSLLECSARSILNSRLIYNIGVIPHSLVKYLDEAKYCFLCKKACFDHYYRYLMQLPRFNISNEIRAAKLGNIATDCYFCSSLCARWVAETVFL